jgi:peptidoglycan/LPS O-acetylase OafA/YrhL
MRINLMTHILPPRIASPRQVNNFDLIRLFAAALVVFSHSCILTDGNYSHEPLSILTGGSYALGRIAVDIFFVISGFLITMSFESTNSLPNFLWKRCLRIFPALIVLLFLTTFIIGPIATALPLHEYFSRDDTYAYLTNVRLFRLQYSLPRVFENNPYPNAVNGSLWTLAYEFVCYLLVAILGVLGILKKRKLIATLFFATLLPLPVSGLHQNAQTLISLFSFFSAYSGSTI